MGQPHFHRLRLERSKVSQTKAHKAKQVWELVAEDLDEESHSFLDSGIEVLSCLAARKDPMRSLVRLVLCCVFASCPEASRPCNF